MIKLFNNIFKSNFEKNKEVYKQYLESKSVKSLDTYETTYKVYENNMKLFLNWLKTDKDYFLFSKKMLDEFPSILDRFMLYCIKEKNNSKITVNNKITAISSFYIWARRNRKVPFNPVLDIERQKKAKQEKRRNSYFLTVEEIKYIKEHMKNNPNDFDIKSRLMFNLFLDSAVRISEMRRLTISSLKLDNNVFVNIRQKGGELRDVNFSDETKEMILEYLEWREKRKIDTDIFWATKRNNKFRLMSRETIRARIRKIGRIIGIKDLYPHTLRKTIINLVSSCGSIEDGALIAHHKDTRTTKEHYIKTLNGEDRNKRIALLRAKAGI